MSDLPQTFLQRPVLRGWSRPNIVLLVAVTAAGTLGMHIFVPGMPDAAADFGAPAGVIQLTITLYLIGLAVGQLFYGPLSDRFGRRPLLLGALVLYIAGSLIALAAPSPQVLIGARVIQALGGCGGLVLGRAMLRDGTTAERAAGQLALLNLAMSIAPAAAPAVGGFLSALGGWRSIFVFLALAGAVMLVASLLTVPETNRQRIPLPGIVPILRSYGRLLRSRNFCGYAVGGACTTTSMYAFLSASPFLLVDVLHRPAAEIGLYYLLLIGGISVGSVIASRLAGRVSLRSAARGGCWVALLGALLLMLADVAGQLSVFTMIAPMVLFTLGAGIASPNAISGAISADPRAIGAASGLYGFLQMTFGAVCTLIVGVWQTGSALPSATVLVVSALVGQLAFTFGPRR